MRVCSFFDTKKLTIGRGYYNIEGNYEKKIKKVKTL